MTDPVLRMDPAALTVERGGQARVQVSVHSPSNLVEGFRLEVLGDAAGWATVSPPTVEVFPGTEASAVVAFAPPADGVLPSGVVPFGVRAVSLVDHYSGDVVEGTLEIGRVYGLAAKLTPVTSSGRWKGRHVVTLTNWGNTPATIRLAASDPDERLGFLIRPAELALPLGATRIARVTVRTRHPAWRGMTQRLPFQVVSEPATASVSTPATPGDPSRPVLDGAFSQRPIVSRGAATILLAALLAGAAGLFFLVRGLPPQAPQLRMGALPPTPATASLEPTDKNSITVTWEPVGQAVGYLVLHGPADDPGRRITSDPIDSQQTAHVVTGLGPATEHCFHVVAVSAAGSRSEPADAGCDATLVPAGDGRQPTAEQWIATRGDPHVKVPLNSSATQAAQTLVQQLEAEGVRPGILDTSNYPDMTGQPTLWVYEGPFDSEEDARAVCRVQPSPDCRVIQPGRQQAPAVTPPPTTPAVPPSQPTPPPATPTPEPTRPSASPTP